VVPAVASILYLERQVAQEIVAHFSLSRFLRIVPLQDGPSVGVSNLLHRNQTEPFSVIGATRRVACQQGNVLVGLEANGKRV
jgi:hypothetical protein